MARIEDAGQKIGGARKDWRDRAMHVADLDDLTVAEQEEHVQKANIWKPDWKAMVDAGASPKAQADQ